MFDSIILILVVFSHLLILFIEVVESYVLLVEGVVVEVAISLEVAVDFSHVFVFDDVLLEDDLDECFSLF